MFSGEVNDWMETQKMCLATQTKAENDTIELHWSKNIVENSSNKGENLELFSCRNKNSQRSFLTLLLKLSVKELFTEKKLAHVVKYAETTRQK